MDDGKNLEREVSEHLDESTLILHLDGELPSADSVRVRSHLARCTECRKLEAEFAQASGAFSLLHRDLDDSLAAPPRNWAGFDERVEDLLGPAPVEARRRESRLGDLWRKVLATPVILPWGLATATAGLLVGYLWLRAPVPPTLSVQDVLSRAEQGSAVRPAGRAVIYRKIRILESSAPNFPITIEMWKRTSDGRVNEAQAGRRASEPGARRAKARAGRKGAAAGRGVRDNPEIDVLSDLHEIYAANHLDWSDPISARQFKNWVESGPSKDERVVRESLPQGGEAYRLIARAATSAASTANAITEMQLQVRSYDWHAMEERLTVHVPSGVRTYEVAELEYRELPLSEIPASIFDDRSNSSVPSSDLPRKALGAPPLSGTAFALEVLARLDALDALVKDQVEVSRAGTEGIKLEGVVGSDRRKNEILAGLGALASNPAIRVNLVTPSETSEESSITSRSSQMQAVQVPLDSSAASPYVRNWLVEHRSLSGARLESETERYQMEAVVLSTDAQLQAQALRRILAVVPNAPAEPADAEKWRTLVGSHAGAVEQKIQALQGHLAPVFRESPLPQRPIERKLNSPGDLHDASDRLVNLLTTSDRFLWKGLSHNAADSEERRLTDPGFWRILEEEDSLATQIEREAYP